VNKAELVAKVAERSGLTKKDSEKAVSSVFETIEDALAKGDKVSLVGFGTFERRVRQAREGRNPQTGAVVKIKATKAPVFKAGKALKDRVNE
jgi:DNA-binding protein HU-beta